jgi:hypothetical protein
VKAKNRLDRILASVIIRITKILFYKASQPYPFSLGRFDGKIELPKNPSIKPPWDFEVPSEARVQSIDLT